MGNYTFLKHCLKSLWRFIFQNSLSYDHFDENWQHIHDLHREVWSLQKNKPANYL